MFDLDGVLVDSRDVHYQSLNNALMSVAGIKIEYEEHLAKYDGLGTTTKLKMLTKEKDLDPSLYDKIWKKKQEETFSIFNKLPQSDKLIALFTDLHKAGYKIAVASNAIRNTVKIILLRLGILPYIDLFLSNEDVERNKPAPDIYWICMMKLNAIPATTLIVEDSHIGRKGVIDSKAYLCPVDNPEDVTAEKIWRYLNQMNEIKQEKIPYRNKNLLVVIPMAGQGSRFEKSGYSFPKPLIDVRGKPMIQMVVDNLNVIPGKFLFFVRKDHYEKYALEFFLKQICPKESEVEIVVIDQVTEGTACTVLTAKETLMNWNGPMLLANSDQFVEWNSSEVLYAFSNKDVDGGILTFTALHPKWSYAKLDKNGNVCEVAEKKVISDIATVGIYYWTNSRDFVGYAQDMISKNIRTNGEFYITPIYNEMIADGCTIRTKHIERMWGTGTPEDLETFIRDYKGDL